MYTRLRFDKQKCESKHGKKDCMLMAEGLITCFERPHLYIPVVGSVMTDHLIGHKNVVGQDRWSFKMTG